jgi:HEAT repeat protein
MKSDKILIQQVLDALLDLNTPFSTRFLFRLSDLEGKDLQKFSAAWPELPSWRRQGVMEDAEELGESDDLLSFESLAMIGIDDPEAAVRLPAVRILWEYNDREFIPVFTRLLKNDQDSKVRAAAATGLGNFVLAGELDELPPKILAPLQRLLLDVAQGTDADIVKRKALEALGYSERNEVVALIEKAYSQPSKEWKASALIAMGHSADDRWYPKIMANLDSNLPLLRTEAARAAGELEMHDSVEKLLELLEDPDEEVRDACIWSLAQIGGLGVREALENLLEDTEDEDEQEYIEDALELLAFTEESGLFTLIDLDEDNEIDDLESRKN